VALAMARTLGIDIGFGVNKGPLVGANREVDKLKANAMQSESAIGGLGRQATITGNKMKNVFQSVQRTLGRGVSLLERYRYQLGAAAVAGTFAIGMLAKDAANANEIVNKFNVVFGKVADTTKQWAISFSRDVGRSKYAVFDWLNSFQDVLVPMGLARKEAARFSKRMVDLAADLGSFNNVATNKAAQMMQSALIGNHEAVRQLGIQISETNLDLAAQRAGYQKNFRELGNLTKMQLRFKEMIRQSSDAIDDATRTKFEFNNQLLRFKGFLRDIRIDMGQSYLPTFTRVLIVTNKFLGVLKGSEELQVAAKILGIATAVTALGAAIGFASAAWGVIGGFFAAPYFAVAGAIVALIIIVEDLWTAFRGGDSVIVPLLEQFLDFLNLGYDLEDVLSGIQVAANFLWGVLKVGADFIAPLVKDKFEATMRIIKGFGQVIGGVIGVIAGLIKGLVTDDFSTLNTGFENLSKGLQNAILGILDFVVAPFAFAKDKIVQFINWLVNDVDIMGALGNMINTGISKLPGFLQGAANKILDFIGGGPTNTTIGAQSNIKAKSAVAANRTTRNYSTSSKRVVDNRDFKFDMTINESDNPEKTRRVVREEFKTIINEDAASVGADS